MKPVLSICIATYRRAEFIAETIESILPSLSDGVELVVVDGASPDATGEIMTRYSQQYSNVRYIREEVNSGVDADYDKAVGYATGEYCWLMSDDDLLNPGAVSEVLQRIKAFSPDLLVVNAELVSKSMVEIIDANRLGILSDREYGADSRFAFMRDCASYLSFIGCVVIRRAAWMARRRVDYYGSCFIHVGVIFQSPPLGKMVVIAKPLISIRHGNSLWSPRSFEIWNFNWQNLIWSFDDYPDAIKSTITSREPWRKVRTLLYARAMGAYSLREYDNLLRKRVHGWGRLLALVAAVFPAWLANAGVLSYFLFSKKGMNLAIYDLLRVKSAGPLSRLLCKLNIP